MGNEALIKVTAARAADVCTQYELAPEAADRLDDDVTAADYLSRLMEGGQFGDAAQFLSHALPKREAVWWACLCLRATLPEPVDAAEADVLKAVETWVYKPVDENRRAAFELAQAMDFKLPSAFAALAAFFGAGSLGPPDQPEIPPEEALTGSVAYSAIHLAAIRDKPELAEQRYQTFLDRGMDIARGGTGRT